MGACRLARGSRRRAWSARTQRGSLLVEAAFVTPLFIALLFAIIEGGFALHDRLSVGNMSLAGARSGSGHAADVFADYYVLAAIRQGSGAIRADRVTAIVVFRTTGPTGHVPSACKTASVAGTCNRYSGADLAKDTTQFGCVGPPGPTAKIDAPWCPTTRKTALTGAKGPPDYIGVYVEVLHRSLTGVLGHGFTMRADTIMRIEPRTLT